MSEWKTYSVCLMAGALAGAGAVYVALGWRRAAIATAPQPQSIGTAEKSTVKVKDFLKDEVLSEQLTRNVQFFGEEGQQAIANSFVVVVGLGVSTVSGGRRGRCMGGETRGTVCGYSSAPDQIAHAPRHGLSQLAHGAFRLKRSHGRS